jgi:hypothetical protein
MMVLVIMVVMIMVMVMLVLIVMMVLMIMLMVVLMLVSRKALLFEMPVQVRHVVIVAVMFFIQDHVEITAINTCLFDSADAGLKPGCRNSLQDPQELLLIRPQVKQGCNGHVAADPGPALQI